MGVQTWCRPADDAGVNAGNLPDRKPVLVLAPERRARALSGYLLVLGYRAHQAADVTACLRSLADAPGIRVGLLASDSGLASPAAAVREIGDAFGTPLVWIVFGDRPDSDDAGPLRRAGARYALADPFTDEELRFVLNEAHHTGSPDAPRVDQRVPVSFRARVVTKTGERVAHVCNLSELGAYLATPRPALRGGLVTLHLPLDDAALELTAQVIWNNVPGNLRRPNAPIGMGVRFADVPADAVPVLRRYLREREQVYRL
jgi:hypothetical protein